MNIKQEVGIFRIGFNSRYFRIAVTRLRNYHREPYALQLELGWFWVQILKGNK